MQEIIVEKKINIETSIDKQKLINIETSIDNNENKTESSEELENETTGGFNLIMLIIAIALITIISATAMTFMAEAFEDSRKKGTFSIIINQLQQIEAVETIQAVSGIDIKYNDYNSLNELAQVHVENAFLHPDFLDNSLLDDVVYLSSEDKAIVIVDNDSVNKETCKIFTGNSANTILESKNIKYLENLMIADNTHYGCYLNNNHEEILLYQIK
jgi:hypothetical protein